MNKSEVNNKKRAQLAANLVAIVKKHKWFNKVFLLSLKLFHLLTEYRNSLEKQEVS